MTFGLFASFSQLTIAILSMLQVINRIVQSINMTKHGQPFLVRGPNYYSVSEVSKAEDQIIK